MSGMWFVLGVLCGCAAGVCLPKRKHVAAARSGETARKPTKAWGETRNFLYYDGTEMPVVKEEINEQ